MSACLFTVSQDFFTHKKVSEIEDLINHWQKIIDSGPVGLFGGNDQIGGCHNNIQMAKYELTCRAANTTAHSIQYRLNCEMREGAFNIKKALMDASLNGAGYIRCGDKNPDKWFEYVTEAQLIHELRIKK